MMQNSSSMARRSRGLKSKGRGKFTKRPRERGLPPVTRGVQDISPGRRVAIIIDPGVQKGQPHHRYHGRTGVVQRMVGRAFVVEIGDGGKRKSIICAPEHLRVVR
ncbi:MAG: 50S ribosomal protein L21e [Candidatus Hadarchaeales archaeon]